MLSKYINQCRGLDLCSGMKMEKPTIHPAKESQLYCPERGQFILPIQDIILFNNFRWVFYTILNLKHEKKIKLDAFFKLDL